MVYKKIDQAVEAFRKGGVVVFPTDTVWGIGAALDRNEGIERMYSIKRRKKSKPTAVLVENLAMAKQYGVFNKEALVLVKKYWPGGLTIIVKARKGNVVDFICGKGGTLGLRVPEHSVVLSILSKLGVGIAAGSANFTGAKVPWKFEDIDDKLLESADFVVQAREKSTNKIKYESGGKLPSTVVDVSRDPFVVLRQGLVRIS